MSESESRRDAGLQIRRDVLGTEYVDKSMSSTSDFNKPVQDLVTEFVWGTVWQRPGLDRKTRSLLNLAMLTALNRPHELGIHVAGAIRNGCTPDEVQEALLQTTVYCGAPAALDAFRVAAKALSELDTA